MSGEKTITPESFDALLAWLDDNGDEKGSKYEAVRRRLTRLFFNRGCGVDAEELADETFTRVITLLPKVREANVPDPIRYIYGVARNIYHEWLRKPRPVSLDALPAEPSAEPEPPPDLMRDCLSRCLAEMDAGRRGLLLEYYRYDKSAKIAHHKRMAAAQGATTNALRIKAFRARSWLEECVRRCTGGGNESAPAPHY